MFSIQALYSVNHLHRLANNLLAKTVLNVPVPADGKHLHPCPFWGSHTLQGKAILTLIEKMLLWLKSSLYHMLPGKIQEKILSPGL